MVHRLAPASCRCLVQRQDHWEHSRCEGAGPPEQRWDDPWLCTRLSTLSGCFSLEHYAVMVLWRNVVDNAIELRAGNPGEHPETG